MLGGVEDDLTTATGASAQPPGLAEMVAALAGAFQNLSSPRGLPAVKLSRFGGFPQKQGDPTVSEWLQEILQLLQTGNHGRSEGSANPSYRLSQR